MAGRGLDLCLALCDLRPRVLATGCLLNEAEIYGVLGVLALINKPTEQNPRENISLQSHMEAELESPSEMQAQSIYSKQKNL